MNVTYATSERMYMGLYYLFGHGFSVATSIRLGMNDIPVTISSSINKVIYTDIDNDDPLWNVSLNYSFYF